jgi:hypothetical protein
MRTREHARRLVIDGVEAARAGDMPGARVRLFRAARIAPGEPATWYWLGAALDDPGKQQRCMARVLELQPDHERAGRALEAPGAQPFETFDYDFTWEGAYGWTPAREPAARWRLVRACLAALRFNAARAYEGHRRYANPTVNGLVIVAAFAFSLVFAFAMILLAVSSSFDIETGDLSQPIMRLAVLAAVVGTVFTVLLVLAAWLISFAARRLAIFDVTAGEHFALSVLFCVPSLLALDALLVLFWLAVVAFGEAAAGALMYIGVPVFAVYVVAQLVVGHLAIFRVRLRTAALFAGMVVVTIGVPVVLAVYFARSYVYDVSALIF